MRSKEVRIEITPQHRKMLARIMDRESLGSLDDAWRHVIDQIAAGKVKEAGEDEVIVRIKMSQHQVMLARSLQEALGLGDLADAVCYAVEQTSRFDVGGKGEMFTLRVLWNRRIEVLQGIREARGPKSVPAALLHALEQLSLEGEL